MSHGACTGTKELGLPNGRGMGHESSGRRNRHTKFCFKNAKRRLLYCTMGKCLVRAKAQ